MPTSTCQAVISGAVARRMFDVYSHSIDYRGDPYDQSYYASSGLRREGYWDYPDLMARHGFAETWADDIESETGAVSGKDILEVGCAYGYLAKELQSRGATVKGIDISAWAISQANILNPPGVGLSYQVGDILAVTIPPASYDLIVCICMIECLNNDTEIATVFNVKLKPALKTGGDMYFLFDYDSTDPIYVNRTPAEWDAFISVVGFTETITDIGGQEMYYKTRAVLIG